MGTVSEGKERRLGTKRGGTFKEKSPSGYCKLCRKKGEVINIS
jgi:hypothetical protein